MEDGGIEGLVFNLSPKNNKVHKLKTEHSSPKWAGNRKKDVLLQKKKRRPHQEVGGAISRYKQPHTSRWEAPQTEN